MRFKGKVAIITGGSSGIGKETAKRLVAEGASVVLSGKDEASSILRQVTLPNRRLEPLSWNERSDNLV